MTWVGAIAAAGKVTIILVLALAAATDLRSRVVPLELVMLVALLGLAINLASAPDQAPVSLLVSAILLAILSLLSRFRAIGGGDAKLIAATSLTVQPSEAFTLLLEISLSGGLLALIYFAAPRLRRSPRVRSCLSWPWSLETRATGRRLLGLDAVDPSESSALPYATAVFIGTLWHYVR